MLFGDEGADISDPSDAVSWGIVQRVIVKIIIRIDE